MLHNSELLIGSSSKSQSSINFNDNHSSNNVAGDNEDSGSQGNSLSSLTK